MAIDGDGYGSTSQFGYEGELGRTRTEAVHVLGVDGRFLPATIHRAVNVATDPELESLLLDDVLNRMDDGRKLAVPVVYHDPRSRRFLLVVPVGLSHEALKLRAELMLRVAEDTAHSVPAYVANCTTVVGNVGLRAELGLGSARVTGTEMDEIRRREDTLARRLSELEAAQRRLGERERALERRVGSMQGDEEAVASGVTAPGGWQEVQPLSAGGRQGATVVGAVPIADAFSETFADNDRGASNERNQNTSSTRPPPLRLSRSSVDPPPLRRRSGVNIQVALRANDDQQTVVAPFPVFQTPPPLPSQQVEEVIVASLPPPLPHRGVSRPPPLPPAEHVEHVEHADQLDESDNRLDGSDAEDDPEDDVQDVPAGGQPEVDPPEVFDAMAAGEMAFVTEPSPWLFVRFDEPPLDVHRDHRDLLVQYQEVEGRPVVVLTLLLGYGEHEQVHRAMLDPLSPEGAAMLEALSVAFQAKVSMYLDDDYLETRELASMREGVVQQVLARVTDAGEPRLAWDDAVAFVWDNVPPVRSDDLPFGPPKRQAATPASVLAAVERLSRWMQPAKLDEAALLYSVPQHVIDASVKRFLGAAASYGVALPSDLAELAIARGVAVDEPALVRAQLAAFAKRVEDNTNDLGGEWTAANWQRLFDGAERCGVAIDPAWQRLSNIATDGSSYARENRTALLAALNRPAERVAVAEELLRRHDAPSVPAIIDAMVMLGPVDVARLMARVVQIGDEAGDALLTGLASPSPAVRQSAALALGRLRLRRALSALLKLLHTENTELWTEVARAIGDLGPSAVRAVTRALTDSRGQEIRFAYALAYLAIGGAAQDVRKLESASDPRVAKAAREASAHMSRLKWEDAVVRDGGTLPEPTLELELAQAFYYELSQVPGL